MRRNRVILLALVLLSLSCTRKPEQSLIGKWKGTDSGGKTASLIFNSDHTFKMVLGNMVVDGAMFGGKAEWRADMSRDPMTLDFIIIASSGDQSVLPIIFRFVTDSKIQIRMSKDMQSRPTGFSVDDTENQLVLVKQ